MEGSALFRSPPAGSTSCLADEMDGPQFTAATLSQNPAAVAREIATWSSADAVSRLKAIGVRCIQPTVHGALIDTVLNLPWRRSDSLCAAVLDFSLELVSAVPSFNKVVIDSLVTSWLPQKAATDHAQAEELSATTLARVHETLRGILRVTPLAISNLFSAVKEHLPHRRRELSHHVGFLRELLEMLNYCYPLRSRVVHLLVERLVDLDVQIAMQIRALEEAADNEDEDDTIFEVESDTSAEELSKMRLNATKLDTLLSMLLELTRTTCTAPRPVHAGAGASVKTDALSPQAKATGGDPDEAAMSDALTALKADEDVTSVKTEAPVKTEHDHDAGSINLFTTAHESSPFRKGAAALLGTAHPPSLDDLPLLPPQAALTTSKAASSDCLPSMLASGAQRTPGKVARTASAGCLSAASPASQTSTLLEAPADPAEHFFEALVASFRASVLPTYKCRAVQFLMFYVSSFDASFSRSFLQLLLAQMRSEHVHAEQRLACVMYVCSFLARAKFVTVDVALATVREMITWAAAYQTAALHRLMGEPPTLDVHLHGTFYAVMQGVLYICCYRHEQLQRAEAGSALAGLATSLHAVLHGALNPLKFCLEGVVHEFERLEVCDIAELVTANESLAVASRTAAGEANVLEDFFPFDPLHGFHQSAAIVAPLYQEWITRRSEEPRDSNLSSCRSGDPESLAASVQGMSVTPCSGDEAAMGDHMRRRLAENRSLVSNLVGASPLASPLFQPTYAAAKVPSFGLH